MTTATIQPRARLRPLVPLLWPALARLGQAAFVLWAAFSLSFLILYALPGDPVSIMLSQNGKMSAAEQAQVATLKARYHDFAKSQIDYAPDGIRIHCGLPLPADSTI